MGFPFTTCSICKKEKDPYALQVCRDIEGNPILMCIECNLGSKEIEDFILETQKSFFDAADKICQDAVSILLTPFVKGCSKGWFHREF